MNGDSLINDDDRQYAGSPFPKFEAGMVFNADYKGISLSVQLVYFYGNKVFNGNKMWAYGCGRHKDLYYMWTPQNPDSDIPASRINSEHNVITSYSIHYTKLYEGMLVYLAMRWLELAEYHCLSNSYNFV